MVLASIKASFFILGFGVYLCESNLNQATQPQAARRSGLSRLATKLEVSGSVHLRLHDTLKSLKQGDAMSC